MILTYFLVSKSLYFVAKKYLERLYIYLSLYIEELRQMYGYGLKGKHVGLYSINTVLFLPCTSN